MDYLTCSMVPCKCVRYRIPITCGIRIS
jgi:hypothetical protein